MAAGARILEFDGARWRALPAAAGGSPAALAIDADGRLWFSTPAITGYYEPDARGELRVVSASARLPADDAGLTGFGASLATNDGVFFANRRRVVGFGRDGGPARVWRFDGDPLVVRLWLQDGAVHVRGSRDALRLVGDEFRPVPGLRTAAMIARADPAGGWQLVTNDGVRRWDGGYRAITTGQFGSEFGGCAAFLRDGRIAFGTNGSGVIMCDAHGYRQQTIDRALGLPANHIDALCADREGGLWLGLRNGLVRLQIDSPFARHGAGTAPGALALHRNQVYVGGDEGLWRRDPDGKFHAAAGVSFPVRTLVSHDDELYVTGPELRRVTPGDRTELIAKMGYGLLPITTAPGHFVHGNDDGLALDLTTDGQWRPLGRHEKISGYTYAACEWPAGVAWAVNAAGVWRVDFRDGVRPDAPARCYTAGDGLPASGPNNTTLVAWQGGLSASVRNRLLRFDEAADRFEPETRIEGLPRNPDGSVPATAAVGADRTLWLQLRDSAATLARVVSVGPNRWRAEPLDQPELARLRAVTLLDDRERRTLWMATTAGLISRDLEWRPEPLAPPVPAMIRRVVTPDGAVVWADGDRFVSETVGPALAAGPSRSERENRNGLPASGSPAKRLGGNPLRLRANQNALRVLFAAPMFRGDHLGRTYAQFRTRLEGLDTDWSEWRDQATREFTNLPYRDFVLHVQARDHTGRESAVAMLAFSIAPPWWLTRWACGGYGVLGLLAVTGIVRSRTRALRNRAERLERTVAERTRELAASNAQLARQNTELERLRRLELDEKISAQLEAQKNRLELLRYQLNPHFLFNALNVIGAQTTRRPEVAREMMHALSEFCRLALHRADEGTDATVAAEIEMLKSYLAIEQARRGPDMHVAIDIAPNAADMPLPPFLLLPLVENAVKYGSRTSDDRLTISISASLVAAGVSRLDKPSINGRLASAATLAKNLLLEIANSGTWIDTPEVPVGYGLPAVGSAKSGGIGLKNLRERLERHYPHAHQFSTTAENGRVIARVVLNAPPINPTASDSSQNSGLSSQPDRA